MTDPKMTTIRRKRTQPVLLANAVGGGFIVVGFGATNLAAAAGLVAADDIPVVVLAIAIAAVSLSVVISIIGVIVEWKHGGGFVRGVNGSPVLRAAAGLLPRGAADRYHEEWRGELYDLRAEGASWCRRVGYVLGILLCSVPKLAVTLRLGGESSRA